MLALGRAQGVQCFYRHQGVCAHRAMLQSVLEHEASVLDLVQTPLGSALPCRATGLLATSMGCYQPFHWGFRLRQAGWQGAIRSCCLVPALLLLLPFSAPCTQLQSCPEQPVSALQDQPAIRCAAEGCWDAEPMAVICQGGSRHSGSYGTQRPLNLAVSSANLTSSCTFPVGSLSTLRRMPWFQSFLFVCLFLRLPSWFLFLVHFLLLLPYKRGARC